MRMRLLVALAALLLPGLPALAGPLDPPPPDTAEVWLIEWAGGSAPRLQHGEITHRWRRNRSVLAVISFDVIGRRRELYGGYWSGFVASGGDGAYPSVWHDGQQMLPSCQARAACEHPASLTDTWELDLGNVPHRQSYYVIALNHEIEKITSSPGWKPPRKLEQKLRVQIAQPDGTGARVGWVTGIEHFTGATAPGGRYGSFAFTVVPCGALPGGGGGNIVLTGGDPDPQLRGDTGIRRARCDPQIPYDVLIVRSAANRQTTWRVDGEVTSIDSTYNQFVVIDLPRFPS